MVAVLQRYRVALVIFSLVVLALATWLLFTKHNSAKIPLRGVYVVQNIPGCRS